MRPGTDHDLRQLLSWRTRAAIPLAALAILITARDHLPDALRQSDTPRLLLNCLALIALSFAVPCTLLALSILYRVARKNYGLPRAAGYIIMALVLLALPVLFQIPETLILGVAGVVFIPDMVIADVLRDQDDEPPHRPPDVGPL